MRVCNCLFKRARMGLRSTFLIFHSIWITLAMQSRQYCQSQYPRFLCLRNSFLCANSVYAICLFPVKVIFDSMTRCSTLWGHFVTLSLCLKISVFTLVLMLFTFSFFSFFLNFWHKLLSLAFFPSHEVDFPFPSLHNIAYKVRLLNVFIFVTSLNDCSYTMPVYLIFHTIQMKFSSINSLYK